MLRTNPIHLLLVIPKPMEYLSLLMLAPLTNLIISDFRHREVSLLWLVVLAIGTVCIPIIQDGVPEVLKRSGLNLLMVAYMSVGVLLWSWFKARRVVNPINLYVGLGDLIFFLLLVPLFSFNQYVYLLVGCMVFSLVWWWSALLCGAKPRNIPLIATSSIVVAVAIMLKVFLR